MFVANFSGVVVLSVALGNFKNDAYKISLHNPAHSRNFSFPEHSGFYFTGF